MQVHCQHGLNKILWRISLKTQLEDWVFWAVTDIEIGWLNVCLLKALAILWDTTQ